MKRISHVLEFLLAIFLSSLVNLVPFSKIEKVAALLVALFNPFLSKAYTRIFNNIQYVFPDMTDGEKRSFARENLVNIVRVSLEVMQARKFRKKDFIMKYVQPASEEVKNIFSNKEKGIVVIQGHFGSWEIPVAYYSHIGVKVSYSMQRLSNPYVNWLVAKRRENYGGTAIYSDDTPGLLRSLKKIKTCWGWWQTRMREAKVFSSTLWAERLRPTLGPQFYLIWLRPNFR